MPAITLRPEVEVDIAEAVDWYESRATGMGSEFLRAVEASIASVQRNPQLHRVVFSKARRAPLRRFPYSLVYVAREDDVLVVACVHHRRHASRWMARL